MEVQAGEISVGLKNVNMIVANWDHFARHARKTVVVGNFLYFAPRDSPSHNLTKSGFLSFQATDERVLVIRWRKPS